ncbi:MAG: VOC family protein [Chloroflexi bacterium]|nr:VOC family protein [Chloroflexota bacterium]
MLPPNLALGYVHLTVSSLDRSLAFYQKSLGFKVRQHDAAAGTAYLGAGGPDLLALTELPGARPAPRRTGLYHFAILVPSRLELAHSLKNIANTQTPVQGFADHLASEAIYLPDPDGNGIEIYRDRPRNDWYDANGNFRMGTEPLDIDGVIAELEGNSPEWNGLDSKTVLGHMHLKIASVRDSQPFYCNVLGFDQMASWHNALFISAGGYHHHLGLNTWESSGAPPPPPDAAGLRYFTVQVPEKKELDKILDRVRHAGLPVEEHRQGALVRDPSQNAIVFGVN